MNIDGLVLVLCAATLFGCFRLLHSIRHIIRFKMYGDGGPLNLELHRIYKITVWPFGPTAMMNGDWLLMSCSAQVVRDESPQLFVKDVYYVKMDLGFRSVPTHLEMFDAR